MAGMRTKPQDVAKSATSPGSTRVTICAVRRLFLTLVLAGAVSHTVSAQWLKYPNAGIPRLPDGKPNLSAPTPRTADGKPDLSGIWEPAHNRPCPPGGCADFEVPQEFINIGWSLPDGLPYQPWAAALAKKRTADLRKDDPTTHCLPVGIVRLATFPLMRKIAQLPGVLIQLNELNSTYRQIFTDGRPLPVDPQPSWSGYSSAAWEGDTLKVETSGFRDGLWLDSTGSPLTDAARITEKFRRPNFGNLEIELTVDDPKAYTRAWTVTLTHVLVPDTELLDYICLENELDRPHIPK
jgi:hypothetical protein